MNVKSTLYAFSAVMLLTLASVLTACIHDSHASGSGGSSTGSPVRLLGVSQGNAKAVNTADRALAVAFGKGGDTSPRPQQVSAVSAGTVLGTVMNTDPYSTPVVTIQTDTGVMYRADSSSGDVQQADNLYYESTDCSGQAFAIVSDSGGASVSTLVFRNGGAAFVENDGSVGMILKMDNQIGANAQSDRLADGTCNPLTLNGSFFYQVNPNDTTKTHLAGANVGQIGFTGQ